MFKAGRVFYAILLGSALLACLLRSCSPYHKHSKQFKEILDEMKNREASFIAKKNTTVGFRKRLKLSTNSYVTEHGRSREWKSPNQKENATLLMLVRNWELEGALKSMRSLEDRFNRVYNYNWTFLNDVPFTQEFIDATSLMASGRTEYALIPSSDWDMPSWINRTQFEENISTADQKGILYGSSRSYRNMCRFNSGYFYKQKVLDKYKYYFRVEPEVEYFCDFQYDPFVLMRKTNKKYGFVIALYEYENTIPTLWNTTLDFMKKYPEHLHPNNSFAFLTDTSAIGPEKLVLDLHSGYNLCHFWSNFEIGDLDFFRSKAYNDYFDHLEASGGFYYERWGDAPVHSLGVGLLLDKKEIHHFEDIGYSHTPFKTCPCGVHLRYEKKCICNPEEEAMIDIKLHSCLPRWWKFGAGKKFLDEY